MWSNIQIIAKNLITESYYIFQFILVYLSVTYTSIISPLSMPSSRIVISCRKVSPSNDNFKCELGECVQHILSQVGLTARDFKK